MTDVKKVATRQSYGEELVRLGVEHDDFVVFDADLAAATQTSRSPAARATQAKPIAAIAKIKRSRIGTILSP